MIHNYGTCGGPKRCDYCRAILFETPAQAVARMTAENHARGLTRSAQAPNAYAPPDGYAIALASRRTR